MLSKFGLGGCKVEQGLHLQGMSSPDLTAFLYMSLDTPLLHVLCCHLLQPSHRRASWRLLTNFLHSMHRVTIFLAVQMNDFYFGHYRGLKLKTSCGKFLNLAHYFPYDVKLRLLAHSRSLLANQKARNAIVGAENLLKLIIRTLRDLETEERKILELDSRA